MIILPINIRLSFTQQRACEPRICIMWTYEAIRFCHTSKRCFFFFFVSTLRQKRGWPLGFFLSGSGMRRVSRGISGTSSSASMLIVKGHPVGLVESAAPDGGFFVYLIRIQDLTLREWIDGPNGDGNPHVRRPAHSANWSVAQDRNGPLFRHQGGPVAAASRDSGFARGLFCPGQGLDVVARWCCDPHTGYRAPARRADQASRSRDQSSFPFWQERRPQWEAELVARSFATTARQGHWRVACGVASAPRRSSSCRSGRCSASRVLRHQLQFSVTGGEDQMVSARSNYEVDGGEARHEGCHGAGQSEGCAPSSRGGEENMRSRTRSGARTELGRETRQSEEG